MAADLTLPDQEMMERQRQGFYDKLEELQDNKASNSRFMTREMQESQISRLDDLENKRVKPTLSDTNLMKGRAILAIESEGIVFRKLVRPGTSLRFVPVEEMYDVLKREHEICNHGGRDIMQDRLKKKYANITVELINLFKDSCLKCGLKKSRVRKGLVVKPILSPRAWHRWQTDLIDMQSQPDGENKFIMHTQDHFTKFCFLQPLKRKTATAVAENLSLCFSVLGPPACLLQSDNGREFKNAEVVDMIKKYWPGLKMVHGKPRHSQSQGSVERGNRDLEAMLSTSMADLKTTHWASLLPMIQLQKNSRFHSGIGRSPLQALTGCAPTYGLEGLNLPEEVVDSLETEEDLRKALGIVEDEETVIVKGSEEVEEQGEQEVQEKELQEINLDKPGDGMGNDIITNLDDLAQLLQPSGSSRGNIQGQEEASQGLFKILQPSGSSREDMKGKGKPSQGLVQQLQPSGRRRGDMGKWEASPGLEGEYVVVNVGHKEFVDYELEEKVEDSHGLAIHEDASPGLDEQLTCITCSEEITNQHERGTCSECNAAAHRTYSCLHPSIKSIGSLLCKYCENNENIEIERQKVKARQEQQAQGMLDRSARRFAPAIIGDNVRVYLSEVDRGRCEFPNVLAVVTEVTTEGMFKLATKEGFLNSHYSRNQFEPLPTKHLLLSEVDTSQSRALRTAANAQSQGGGQGFTRCGCSTSCQANNCKCFKTKVFCNSRCHGKIANSKCLNHD